MIRHIVLWRLKAEGRARFEEIRELRRKAAAAAQI